MATEVTYSTPIPSRHVIGDLVIKFFVVSGATGTVVHTGMSNVLFVEQQPFCKAGTATVITGLSESGGVLTLTTAGGAMTKEVLMVIGREG